MGLCRCKSRKNFASRAVTDPLHLIRFKRSGVHQTRGRNPLSEILLSAIGKLAIASMHVILNIAIPNLSLHKPFLKCCHKTVAICIRDMQFILRASERAVCSGDNGLRPRHNPIQTRFFNEGNFPDFSLIWHRFQRTRESRNLWSGVTLTVLSERILLSVFAMLLPQMVEIQNNGINYNQNCCIFKTMRLSKA